MKIHSSGKISVIDVPKGNMLLEALRLRGFEVISPCGGVGTCGKCKVNVKDGGFVSSCLCPVEEDMEIVLPEPSESLVLANQYIHSRSVELSPGNVVGLSSNPFGVAIDVGTTTLVFQLVELSTGSLLETQTALNPQAKYGADVITRISYCVSHPEGVETLQSEILAKLDEILVHFYKKYGFAPNDIVKICVSGNTTMLHLFLGVNPESLAYVPFTPVFTEQRILKASSLNIRCHPDGELKLLPSLSSYVGADIVAGIASLAPVKEHSYLLFVDVGTNGEMALITPDTIYCCATAAGPAFEGANITCGMGSLTGAINIYNGPDDYKTIGNAKPAGICGSGLIDLVSSLLNTGVINVNGYLDKNFVVVSAGESGISEDIYVTPKDIREIQLAKSAIAAGINILVQQAGISMEDVDTLYIAGGFGNHIRTESAVSTGLIPRELSERVIPVGNTSVTGATLAVTSQFFDMDVRNILSRMKYFDLSEVENFMMEFAMNMEFPDPA